ncbi:WhiB family transcriptional regulator, partial [Streptomyces antibioticus]|uniref:WhiB family transcriptional regulator n=1 Tax=Streptomyces antibioticus TaxID=1890 RepID=UPI0033FE6ED3
GGCRMSRIVYPARTPEAPRRPDWRTRAACLGQWDAMHPDNNENEIAAAKAICGRCPVRVECFWDAVRTGDNEHGIRAGLRPNERRAVLERVHRRQRKAAA